MKRIRVALAGNPNSGKSSIFNMLTGAHQHVGNYPGVTVEKKEGLCTYDGYQIEIIDLPGTYSLTAYSKEELIARDYVLDEAPDVVVDVVDASNLERNLYLATQLIEMNVPLVLAFNNSRQRRTPLCVALAEKGEVWQWQRTLEDEQAEFSYPTLLQIDDGLIHLVYTYRREHIHYACFTETWLRKEKINESKN